ncbi:hypothetical protein IFR04_006129 [Cadophora malorum]|uniref:Transmembrane protein n=1 Tax=Cadophora malorum TaxID=108018 RepID=A0A8H7TL36_9HELO|nr:hypothetical protein IFR04_006129 [Cadophora malorum]
MTLYSADSTVSLVEDDSSLIPILEPCIAFDFSPYDPPSTNSSFTNPSGAEVEDDSDLSWMVPFAEVEDRSAWVPSAVALGVAVLAAAAAWVFWAPYMVWPSRGVGCYHQQTSITRLIHMQRKHDHWPLATTMASDLQPPCEPLIHHMVLALHPFSSVCMTANQDQIWVGPLRFASSTCINVKL